MKPNECLTSMLVKITKGLREDGDRLASNGVNECDKRCIVVPAERITQPREGH
jgi:hypothetical protein